MKRFIQSLIGFVIIGVAVAAVFATRADAKVFFQGERVTVRIVGQIDAFPCSDPHGCKRAVVELRWHNHNPVPGNPHLVACGHPRDLHVQTLSHFNGHTFAQVRACRKRHPGYYAWILKR